MSIAIFTITSELHDEQAIAKATQDFLGSLKIDYVMEGTNYDKYGCYSLNLLYIRTGGTEGIFKKLLPGFMSKLPHPFYLLTSGQSNSLAASMEILSYLQRRNIDGKILHGRPEYIKDTILSLEKIAQVRQKLNGCRLGIIGEPSDWLISSDVDPEIVKKKLGIELIKIPIEEVQKALEDLEQTIPPQLLKDETDPLKIKIVPLSDLDKEGIENSLSGAMKLYHALKTVVEHHQLRGFTIRCFDLLSSVHNTGCTALAKLNSEGVVAGCEGDVPAMITMVISQAITSLPGFQANPARIDPEAGEMMFAHCTIALNMVERFELDTHFESGIGIGIRGFMKLGAVTIFKAAPDLSSFFVAEGELLRNESQPGLCRTQQVIRLDKKEDAMYFLTRPIGNHHIIVPGRWKNIFTAFLSSLK